MRTLRASQLKLEKKHQEVRNFLTKSKARNRDKIGTLVRLCVKIVNFNMCFIKGRCNPDVSSG